MAGWSALRHFGRAKPISYNRLIIIDIQQFSRPRDPSEIGQVGRCGESSSNVTWFCRMSETRCGMLIFGSGTTPILRDRLPLRGPYHWQEPLAVAHRRPELSLRIIHYAAGPTIHLVGLRRSLVRSWWPETPEDQKAAFHRL